MNCKEKDIAYIYRDVVSLLFILLCIPAEMPIEYMEVSHMRISEDRPYDKKIQEEADRLYHLRPPHRADPVKPVRGDSQRLRQWKQRKRGEEGDTPPEREVEDDFEKIEETVREANQRLAKNGSNIRCCVFREKEKICLDVVRLTTSGKKVLDDLCVKDITHEDLLPWLNRIHNLEGIVVDREV